MKYKTPALLTLLFLASIGPAPSEAQSTKPKAATSKKELDTQLTARGKELEAKIKTAEENVAGRVSKKDWAKQLGESDPAYKVAKSYMPLGMGLATPVPAAEAKAARKVAVDFALNRAKARARSLGKSPTTAEAQKLLNQQSEQVAALNRELAAQRTALAGHVAKGDDFERDLLVRQVLHGYAEKVAKQALPGKPQRMTAAEKEEMKRRYYTFINRKAEESAAPRGAK
jgi:hypothetical protein